MASADLNPIFLFNIESEHSQARWLTPMGGWVRWDTPVVLLFGKYK
jgi:hypothetical protein